MSEKVCFDFGLWRVAIFVLRLKLPLILLHRCKKRPLISYGCGTGVAWASIAASMVIAFATGPWLRLQYEWLCRL